MRVKSEDSAMAPCLLPVKLQWQPNVKIWSGITMRQQSARKHTHTHSRVAHTEKRRRFSLRLAEPPDLQTETRRNGITRFDAAKDLLGSGRRQIQWRFQHTVGPIHRHTHFHAVET